VAGESRICNVTKRPSGGHSAEEEEAGRGPRRHRTLNVRLRAIAARGVRPRRMGHNGKMNRAECKGLCRRGSAYGGYAKIGEIWKLSKKRRLDWRIETSFDVRRSGVAGPGKTGYIRPTDPKICC
jgi:hypothetical protein